MAGNADNAALWEGADVYVADRGSAEPTDVTTAWPAAWAATGLLDGEEGFTQGREEESADFYAWGGLLVKRTKSKHKRTIRFACLEDNAVTFGLVNPGSDRSTNATTGLTTATIKVPTNREFALGFEMKDGTKTKRRVVKRATVSEVGEIKESETAPTLYTITVTLYPEANGTLYTELSN